MYRLLVGCMMVCLGTLASAQNSASAAAQTSSTPVQVVYVVLGTTIVTYNVDAQALSPTQVGSLVVPNAVSNPDWSPPLIAVLNDHFVYFVGYESKTQQRLWVFATDATGAPRLPVVQEFNVTNFIGLKVDPQANFAYAVFEGVPAFGSLSTPWYIRRYVVDPASGELSQPQLEATYEIGNGADGTNSCYLSILGFNSSGTSLYDEVICDDGDGTYYESAVNLTTGALSSDVEVYSWENGNTGGFESVQFVAGLMFDFVTPFDYAQGYDSVNIYPVVPSTSTPLLSCAAQMVEACGYGGIAHPSGQYIFTTITADLTQIEKVDVSEKKIVDTSSSVPYWVTQFSPDGTLLYGYRYENSGYRLLIYGFNVATAAVTPGGSLSVPSINYGFYNAERQ